MKPKHFREFAVAASLILAASTSTHAQIVTNFFQAVTNLSPAAYWPLQETTQPPLADVETNLGSFGNIANAIYSSTNAVKAETGVAGGYLAVGFEGGTGSGSFLGVPNASPKISLPVGPFSVEAWIYPSNLNNNLTIMAQAGLTARRWRSFKRINSFDEISLFRAFEGLGGLVQGFGQDGELFGGYC